jgi:hypothetical protein
MLEMLEKCKEESNLDDINTKSVEIDELIKPFIEKLSAEVTPGIKKTSFLKNLFTSYIQKESYF